MTQAIEQERVENTTTGPEHSMQAVVQPGYGTPDILELRRVARPEPGENEVLVEVRAASVNKGDWHMLTGKPYMVRLVAGGIQRPKFVAPGQELAGRVVAVGANVRAFQAGDEVFGAADHGAFAEYACVRADRLARKPSGVSFEQAAALPAGGITALQALRDLAHLKPGQSVLINGASGGVGSFAVQIAKALGAEVTGVCSTDNVEWVRSLGADRVIDYRRERFATETERYDCMLDLVGHGSLAECRGVLKAGGVYVAVAGGQGDWLGPLSTVFKMMFVSLVSRKKMKPYMYGANDTDLATLAEMTAAGKIRSAIEHRFSLDQVPEALERQGTGRVRGKNVIVVRRD